MGGGQRQTKRGAAPQDRGVWIVDPALGVPLKGCKLAGAEGLDLRAAFSNCLWSRTIGLQNGRERGREREGGAEDSSPCVQWCFHYRKGCEVLK